MIADVNVRMTLGKCCPQCVQPFKQCRALSGVCRRETGCQKGDAYRRVWHKEVVVYCLIVAGTQQGLHLLCQHVAHTYRIDLNHLWEHLAYLACQVVAVLLHLLGHVICGKQRVEPLVCLRVDIRRQVFHHIVYSIRHEVFAQLIEHVFYEC